MIKLHKMRNGTKEKTVEISFQKAMGILVGAVITTAVATTFTLLRVSQSDHFILLALDTRVIALEEEIVPSSEFLLQIKNLGEKIDNGFEAQGRRLERIEDRLNENFRGGE